MKEVYFGDFRTFVIQQMKELEKTDYELDSVEWFLLKYLRRVVQSSEAETNAYGKVEGSMRALVRFYIDNIDEHSELGDQCVTIYENYRKTLRESQTT